MTLWSRVNLKTFIFRVSQILNINHISQTLEILVQYYTHVQKSRNTLSSGAFFPLSSSITSINFKF